MSYIFYEEGIEYQAETIVKNFPVNYRYSIKLINACFSYNTNIKMNFITEIIQHKF